MGRLATARQLQHVRWPIRFGAAVGERDIQGMADAGLRGEVDDPVEASARSRPGERDVVRQVAAHEGEVALQLGEPVFLQPDVIVGIAGNRGR